MNRGHSVTLSLSAVLLMIAAGGCGQRDSAPPAAQSEFPSLAALGPVPTPPDNPITPVKVKLGRLLFFDQRTSGDVSTSCKSCHTPELGWGDSQAISRGYPGARHWRNSQTVVNSAYLTKLFWGGEVTSLESQANSAITGNLAGNGDPVMIEERLAQIPEYVALFKESFGVDRPTYNLALKAIATFERVEVVDNNTPFDRYMRGEKNAISTAAVRGKAMFEGKANCIRCHNGAQLSDESYHNLGVPPPPEFNTNVLMQVALRYQHYSRGVPKELYLSANRDLGLYYTTKRDEDKGKFRTPPLRYIQYTAPYMHNGVFATLEEVIDFYNRGGGADPARSKLLEPLALTAAEKADLLEFLRTLSGAEILMESPAMPEYKPMELGRQ